MTTITFRTEGDRIIGFDSQGHSGYAEEGADIVCAGITSAIRLVDATINDVLGLAASVKVREENASISFRLPGGLSETAEYACQSLLTGLMVYFTELHDEFPENIEVLEEE
ncbi:MAG: ribosomal-processing cysteine protease Prp [Ruminococcaceae bacterium]|nr:ribosomal-processing cysteine protease Prp [Oscillospiraceae bacterium]